MPVDYKPKGKKWKSDYVMLAIFKPQQIESPHYYSKRRFRVRFAYEKIDGKTRTQHQAVVYFGSKERKYPIDGFQDINNRKKQRNDPFHPYFWERKLLESGKKFDENFRKIKQQFDV